MIVLIFSYYMGQHELPQRDTSSKPKERSTEDSRLPGSALINQIDERIDSAKQAVSHLIDAHQGPLNTLSRELRNEFLKLSNLNELLKLTDQKNIEDNQRFLKINYKGKEVVLLLNENFQLTSFMVSDQRIDSKHPLNLESFERLFLNSQKVLSSLRISDPRLPDGVPLLADGTARFSFTIDSQEYIAIGDSYAIRPIYLYRVDKKISDEEEIELFALQSEVEVLTSKIKNDLIRERQLGHPVFNFEDALHTPPILFPEIFQPDLQKLSAINMRIRDLKEMAKIVTMTNTRGNTNCIMENLGEDSFRVKLDIIEEEDPIYSDNDCKEDMTFEAGVMRQRRFFGAGITTWETELLSDGGIRVKESFTYKRDATDGTGWKAGENFMVSIKTYDQNQNLLSEVEYEKGRVKNEIQYEDGFSTEVLHYALDSQRPLYRRNKKVRPSTFVFYGKNGEEFRDYNTERKKDSSLTPDKYISKLATLFDSPMAWDTFTTVFMQYIYDSTDSDKPFQRGTKKDHGDYWQTPEETVVRVNENGQSLGDCDDFAFLAQAILLRQGIRAQVIEVPGHAVCAWIEKRPDGRYDAYSICTFGYDKNGQVVDSDSLPAGVEDNGFRTSQDALNSILVKYEKKGLGLEKGVHFRVEDGTIIVLSIPEKGGQEYTKVQIESLIQ